MKKLTMMTLAAIAAAMTGCTSTSAEWGGERVITGADGLPIVANDGKDSAEKQMDGLIADVRKGGYAKAAGYLERAKSAIFAYVRRWLLLGIACPKASSFIERTMRELGRRIKKLAYNWKEAGLNKVSSILLKIFASNEEWEKYWKDAKRARTSP